jgi:hypothetical protein
MLRKFSTIFAAAVGVASNTIAPEDLQFFTNLNSMLSNTAKGLDIRIQNMMHIENDLHAHAGKL